MPSAKPLPVADGPVNMLFALFNSSTLLPAANISEPPLTTPDNVTCVVYTFSAAPLPRLPLPLLMNG
ncbi:MAG TPA: hypothetical protein VLI90_13375 [Tepidisphaeraceae bacterium]|nr:hypothetical protein [Tepidisphaeraceae bacterium]